MKRVLIADDRSAGRELMRSVLERSGYAVFEASNGKEAVVSARQILPDLIILDLHMPELDGFGVLKELRGDTRFAATPIIALTASAMHGDREQALSAGFTSYIAKPVSLSALRSEIQRLLGQVAAE